MHHLPLPPLLADVPISKASLQLDAVLQSPQGQRVTKPQPFALRAELRPKSCVLSKEELDLIEAREKAFRWGNARGDRRLQCLEAGPFPVCPAVSPSSEPPRISPLGLSCSLALGQLPGLLEKDVHLE